MIHRVPAIVPLSRTVEIVRGIRGMLVTPSLFGQWETSLTASARNGTTVTASGTAHTKGSYTSLIDPTSRPSYGVVVRGNLVGATNTNTSMLLDLAYGPTGGGNEQVVLPNLNMGAAIGSSTDGHAKIWFFPCYIPSGTRVSARCQAVVVSDTISVCVWLLQNPLYPFVGGAVYDYGKDEANSRGTSVTPGNGAFGSWTEILQSVGGTSGLIRDHRFWHVGYDQLGDTSIANNTLLIEVGLGPDSSNVTTIHTNSFTQNSTENIWGPAIIIPTYAPAKAGTKLWARIASGETEARGVMVYGID